VLPFGLCEFDVVVIPILYKGVEEKVANKAKEIAESLRGKGYSVFLDDSDLTPGKKYFRWETKGVPVRVEVGQREVAEGNVTIFRRDTKKRITVKEEELVPSIERLRGEILEELRIRAWSTLKGRLVKVRDREGLVSASRGSVIMKAPFCGDRECADSVKEATDGYEVSGKGLDESEEPDGGCVWCGRPAARVVYLAKAF
jgi:prolyl-tRNA synthetase